MSHSNIICAPFPPPKKIPNKVIMWSLFVPPCMFFEASQPVAKSCPCARVYVYVCHLFFNPLYLWSLFRKRGCLNTGCVCEQATGTVRLQSLVSQGHMGEEHREIPTNPNPFPNKYAMETVSRWHAPAHPLPVWFFSDCFSFWQTLGCFLAPLRPYFAPIPAKQEDNFSQSFLYMPIKHLCLCVRGNIPVRGFLVSSWARSQGLIFSGAPPAPLSEPSAPGLSSSSPSLSAVLVYSAAQGPCDKKKEELVQLHTCLLRHYTWLVQIPPSKQVYGTVCSCHQSQENK